MEYISWVMVVRGKGRTVPTYKCCPASCLSSHLSAFITFHLIVLWVPTYLLEVWGLRQTPESPSGYPHIVTIATLSSRQSILHLLHSVAFELECAHLCHWPMCVTCAGHEKTKRASCQPLPLVICYYLLLNYLADVCTNSSFLYPPGRWVDADQDDEVEKWTANCWDATHEHTCVHIHVKAWIMNGLGKSKSRETCTLCWVTSSLVFWPKKDG